MTLSRSSNPFSITKAVDLNDDQIEQLWVAVNSEDDEGGESEFNRPISPMPTFILGAKGSGKTHLMRHQAFELQFLRHVKAGREIRDGIQSDGYIGIYARCSGLQSGRFSGKRQSDEVWSEVFSYYFELWLAHHLLRVCIELKLGAADGDENEFVEELLRLFDKPPLVTNKSLASLVLEIEGLQKSLDFEVNNCLLRGKLDLEITATRGKLVFGIPSVMVRRYTQLKDVLISYDIDEFENLTFSQQVHVNTMLRERESPTTFRVGARTYGIRTHLTLSAGEENIRHSEYQELHLDREHRQRKKHYSDFVRSLVSKRLGDDDPGVGVTGLKLATFNYDWDNQEWIKIVADKPSPQRPHFISFLKNLDKFSVGNKTKDLALENLVCPHFPIVEKLNILLLYQDIFRGRDIADATIAIRSNFERFLSADAKDGSKYKQAMQHYKDDLCAQLLRENGQPQHYCGLDTFITLSSGIPRALLTVLRSTYEWSEFHGEKPSEGGVISLKSQRKGVLEAANWYYHSMRKAGDDGVLVQSSIDRLASMMRMSRYSDKPIEVSLSTFSVSEQQLNSEARRILKLAEDRAFIHRILAGQRDKNSDDIDAKFQLSPMLAPRWDLPLSRRGTISLNPEEAESIFCFEKRDLYELFSRSMRSKLNAPFKGSSDQNDAQLGLFE